MNAKLFLSAKCLNINNQHEPDQLSITISSSCKNNWFSDDQMKLAEILIHALLALDY